VLSEAVRRREAGRAHQYRRSDWVGEVIGIAGPLFEVDEKMTRLPLATTVRLLPLALILSACAVEAPSGPSVPVMPGDGKTLGQFQQDDASCRQYASQQTGGTSPSAVANQAALGSAAVGTGLGAASGAIIGSATGNPGVGAAIGAGAGLVAGSAAGVGNAAAAAGNLQERYDIAYQQCMATTGNRQPMMQSSVAPAYSTPAYPAPVYPAPVYPAPTYYAPPVYVTPPYPAYPAPYPYYYSYYPGPYYYPRPYYPGSSFFFSWRSGGGDHHHHH
jgi:hypothetical protein